MRRSNYPQLRVLLQVSGSVRPDLHRSTPYDPKSVPRTPTFCSSQAWIDQDPTLLLVLVRGDRDRGGHHGGLTLRIEDVDHPGDGLVTEITAGEEVGRGCHGQRLSGDGAVHSS